MDTVLFLTILLIGSSRAQSSSLDEHCSKGVTNCNECLQKPDCVWCADREFSNGTTARCKSSFSQQECSRVINILPNSISSPEGHTYIAPKHIEVSLRQGKPFNISITYTQQNFPVDLYILLDLSYSMRDDKDKLSELGSKIAQEMAGITKDFKLGFGSFVDKTVLPYAKPLKQAEIQLGIVPPYGFKHHLSLTDDAALFQRKVKETSISTNIDGPESGLEAMVQALVCDRQVGWRNNSRKIIILATDDDYHSAGDGKLGGIVIPNDGQCHLTPIPDSDEYIYDWVNKQDYPSVGQVAFVVSERRANVIFAVTAEKLAKYTKLASVIEGSSVAMLTDDSDNIVDVVKDQYQKITSTVTLQDENRPDHISLRYFAKCDENGEFEEKRACQNVGKDQVLEFKVELTLTKCDAVNKTDKLFVSPVGIQEKVEIDIISMCECPCENEVEINSEMCDRKGDLVCGTCRCNPPYSGDKCECDTTEISLNGETCKAPGQDTECSGRGECKCGKCECKSRFSGAFCECDNESCDRVDDKLCSGEVHGTCECGNCICKPGWTGSSCDCSTSTSNCIRPGSSQVCSGQGKCVCNKCLCGSNEEGRFTGTYCENCPGCSNDECSRYDWPLYCSAFNMAPVDGVNCGDFENLPFTWANDTAKAADEEICHFIDKEGCAYTFIYSKTTNDTLRMVMSDNEKRECPKPADAALVAGSTLIATLLIGLLLILLWRLFTYLHDKREFARFETERQKARWANEVNPIYKNPSTKFNNPAYGT